jgi:hypothetical protein
MADRIAPEITCPDALGGVTKILADHAFVLDRIFFRAAAEALSLDVASTITPVRRSRRSAAPARTGEGARRGKTRNLAEQTAGDENSGS